MTSRPIDAGSRRRHAFAIAALFAALAILPGTALADPAGRDGTTTPAFREAIPNIPGKSIVAIVVTYPPGGKTPAHHHASSAFVVGYVLSGAIRSQVDDGPVRVYHAGESWHENPGAHHPVSENASATEPASLLAILVVDSNQVDHLTTIEGH
jgi:quercetin dioxygenase-like cupin family protein